MGLVVLHRMVLKGQATAQPAPQPAASSLDRRVAQWVALHLEQAILKDPATGTATDLFDPGFAQALFDDIGSTEQERGLSDSGFQLQVDQRLSSAGPDLSATLVSPDGEELNLGAIQTVTEAGVPKKRITRDLVTTKTLTDFIARHGADQVPGMPAQPPGQTGTMPPDGGQVGQAPGGSPNGYQRTPQPA